MRRLVSHRGFTLIELTITIVVILILATVALSIGNRVLRKSEADETRAAIEIAATAMHEWSESMGRQPTYGTTDSSWSYIRSGMDDWRYDITIPLDFHGQADVNSLLASRESQLHEAVEELGRRYWEKLQSIEATRAVMVKIDDELLKAEENNGVLQQCLHDSWGTPVMVVFPGRKWRTEGATQKYNDQENTSNGCWRDADGTIRTFEERLQGPARNGRAYLVSAGPDGRFGNLDYSTGNGETFPPNDPAFVQRAEYQHTLDNIYSYEVRTW
ncbi:MAG: type II secretion system protein [Planctomycetota bacterium]|nr:type II secretion system protein [Planctomycetota bacterium]